MRPPIRDIRTKQRSSTSCPSHLTLADRHRLRRSRQRARALQAIPPAADRHSRSQLMPARQLLLLTRARNRPQATKRASRRKRPKSRPRATAEWRHPALRGLRRDTRTMRPRPTAARLTRHQVVATRVAPAATRRLIPRTVRVGAATGSPRPATRLVAATVRRPLTQRAPSNRQRHTITLPHIPAVAAADTPALPVVRARVITANSTAGQSDVGWLRPPRFFAATEYSLVRKSRIRA